MPSPLQVPASFIEVKLDGQAVANAHVLYVNQSAGGRSMDTAKVRMEITAPTTKRTLLLNVEEVEIISQVAGNAQTELQGGRRVLFWGKTSGLHMQIGDNESVIFEARTMPSYFGTPVDGMLEYNPYNGETQVINNDIVFNPVVDGVTRGNMHDKEVEDGRNYLFLDPRRVETLPARSWVDGTDKPRSLKERTEDRFWTVAEAVYFLCWYLNPLQTNYRNPSRDDLKFMYYDTKDSLPIEGLRIPLGTYLPEALDAVLAPFSYSWCVDYLGPGTRKLSFFKRGVGQKKTLKLQNPGESLQLSKSNLLSQNVGVGYQTLVNQVTVVGDHKLYESTFELRRAWPAQYDNLPEDSLTLGSEDYEANPKYHRVWRDWVLNEAGDYIGLRNEYGYGEPYLFHEFGTDKEREILENHKGTGKPKYKIVPDVSRRRRFMPCLTLDTDMSPIGKRGIYVEFKIGDSADWQPIEQLDDASFEILRNECGIRFSGIKPPLLLQDAGASARVRVTASVYSDERIFYVGYRRDNSLQPDVVRSYYDGRERFSFRKVLPQSKFYKKDLPTRELDERPRMKALADHLLNAWDQADTSFSVVIPWFNGEFYELGDVITGVEGRDLDFTIGSTAEQRYPQVVGISFDCQTQTQTLHLESFRDTRFR